MNTRLSLMACALMVAALVVPALAQDPPATLTLSGTVTSSSPTSIVIQADDGSQKTFVIDDRSTVPVSLARGERVTVTYETSGSQTRAVSVSSSDMPPQGATAPRTDMPRSDMPSDRTGTEATGTPGRDRLPTTASPLPLVALMSTLALGCGYALRTFGRRES
jgi:hypothetical protein